MCLLIYQVLLVISRRDYIVNIIERACNPGVFRFYSQLETKGSLPAMIDENDNKYSNHEGIGDLIAAQMEPGVPPPPIENGTAIHMEDCQKLA